jgi:hypothetical protein
MTAWWIAVGALALVIALAVIEERATLWLLAIGAGVGAAMFYGLSV